LSRLVATLQELDFTTAHADALWLSENSKVQGYAAVYSLLFSKYSTIDSLAALVLQEWVKYDLPLRTRPVQIDAQALLKAARPTQASEPQNDGI